MHKQNFCGGDCLNFNLKEPKERFQLHAHSSCDTWHSANLECVAVNQFKTNPHNIPCGTLKTLPL